MSRSMSPCCWLAVCALLLASPMSAISVEEPVKQPTPPQTASDVHKLLQRLVSIQGFRPNTPLQDALASVAEPHGLTILIDTTAFREELQINEPEQQPVRLPIMVNVPLRRVLLQLTAQAQATLIQEGTVLWVCPSERARARVLRQPISVDFDKTPLRNALAEVADQTGFTIILDQHRAADAASSQLSGKFQGGGLEETVRILSDMAGLKAVLVGDIYYVTTEAHASELAAEQKQRQREQKEQPKPPEDEKAKKGQA